jgi:hypothetical protein
MSFLEDLGLATDEYDSIRVEKRGEYIVFYGSTPYPISLIKQVKMDDKRSKLLGIANNLSSQLIFLSGGRLMWMDGNMMVWMIDDAGYVDGKSEGFDDLIKYGLTDPDSILFTEKYVIFGKDGDVYVTPVDKIGTDIVLSRELLLTSKALFLNNVTAIKINCFVDTMLSINFISDEGDYEYLFDTLTGSILDIDNKYITELSPNGRYFESLSEIYHIRLGSVKIPDLMKHTVPPFISASMGTSNCFMQIDRIEIGDENTRFIRWVNTDIALMSVEIKETVILKLVSISTKREKIVETSPVPAIASIVPGIVVKNKDKSYSFISGTVLYSFC